jgi:hypothetical protein
MEGSLRPMVGAQLSLEHIAGVADGSLQSVLWVRAFSLSLFCCCEGAATSPRVSGEESAGIETERRLLMGTGKLIIKKNCTSQ